MTQPDHYGRMRAVNRFPAWIAIPLTVAACTPSGGGELTPEAERARYPHDTWVMNTKQPNPDFVPEVLDFGMVRQSLSLEGEILVIEGDASTVTSGGGGIFGITDANEVAIVQEVLSTYPDVFDTIQIYTTFLDEAHIGTAYYQSIRNNVAGIGLQSFDSRGQFGLPPDGRLSGFSNMNTMLMWGNGSFDNLNTIEGYYHGVIAHELSHRWLFRMQFQSAAGTPSTAFLGRQDAHWSTLAHAYGSIHDGNDFVDNGDDTYTNQGTDTGLSPLELYAMGRLPASEVEDMWYVSEAFLDNQALDKESRIPRGATIRGTRVNVRMDQVIEAMGPRNPPVETEDPYYRAAFVLVTAPGQPRAEWEQHLTVLQAVQADFPETWRRWTNGGGMCTRVTDRCPEPVIRLGAQTVSGGDGDEFVAPGETVTLTFDLINEGVGTAENVQVKLTSGGPTATITGGPHTAPALAEGVITPLGASFEIAVSSTVACGGSVPLTAEFTTEQGPIFTESFTLDVGTRSLRFDPLDEAPDWRVNPDGTDTALDGEWELGSPQRVALLGVVTQPGEDHTPGDGKLSFHTDTSPERFSGDIDGGKTTLETPIFDLSEAVDPTLVFWGWHVAADFTAAGGPAPLGTGDLEVLVSNNGGVTYEELFRVTENTTDWTRYSVRIRDVLEPSSRTRFRFVIEDETDIGNVEAGVDDLEIVDLLGACVETEMPMPMPMPMPMDEEGGCGCNTSSPAGTAIAGFVALLVLGFRRRR